MNDKQPGCQWKLHFGVGQDATVQCGLGEHVPAGATVAQRMTLPAAQSRHSGRFQATQINWTAGDRREYTGPWPGQCLARSGCILHTGHHGRCAT